MIPVRIALTAAQPKEFQSHKGRTFQNYGQSLRNDTTFVIEFWNFKFFWTPVCFLRPRIWCLFILGVITWLRLMHSNAMPMWTWLGNKQHTHPNIHTGRLLTPRITQVHFENSLVPIYSDNLDPICFNCNQDGHIAKRCENFQRMQELQQGGGAFYGEQGAQQAMLLVDPYAQPAYTASP